MGANLTNLANPGYQRHWTCSGSSVRLVAVLLDVGGGALDEGQGGERHGSQGRGRLGRRGRVAGGARRVAVAFRMQALEVAQAGGRGGLCHDVQGWGVSRQGAGMMADLSARCVMVARISLTVSASTSGVDGMHAGSPYTPLIAAASLESMQAAHLVKRTVCPCFTYAVTTILALPFSTWRLHRPLHRARDVGARAMW